MLKSKTKFCLVYIMTVKIVVFASLEHLFFKTEVSLNNKVYDASTQCGLVDIKYILNIHEHLIKNTM